jgi:hypothetical protein
MVVKWLECSLPVPRVKCPAENFEELLTKFSSEHENWEIRPREFGWENLHKKMKLLPCTDE